MKKNLIALAVAAAVLVPGVAFASVNGLAFSKKPSNEGPVLYGLAQITASNQFGVPSGGEGMVFAAHRIRLGVKGNAVPGVQYNFQLKGDGASFDKFGVQLAEINFDFVPAVQLEVGKFKVPVGMEWTQVGGDELTFIQRSMNQELLPDFGAGGMFHSKNVMGTGIYYGLGIFDAQSLNGDSAFAGANMAPMLGGGQSSVGGIATNGSGNYIFGGLLGYKFNPLLNVELSGARGNTDVRGGVGDLYAKNVTAWNVGVCGGLMGLSYMAEYTHDTSYKGLGGYNANDWYVSLAANLHQMTLTPDWLDIQPAVRFERFDWSGNGAPAAVRGQYLNNTTLGVNYSFNPNNPYAARVQLNYVIPTGATSAYRQNLKGYVPANAYAYNTMVLQFQAGF